jgi:hypothetical protein
MKTADELLDEMCKQKENKDQVLELYDDLITSHFEAFLRLVSDDDLLKCVHDDRVMIPSSWMGQKEFKDILGDSYEDFCSRKHERTKQEAIEAELNRRGLKWRQYSDEERDCLWALEHLIHGFGAVVKPEEVAEFRRLVKANGGNVPRLRVGARRGEEEREMMQGLEAVGLIGEWMRDHNGFECVEIKGLKEAE